MRRTVSECFILPTEDRMMETRHGERHQPESFPEARRAASHGEAGGRQPNEVRPHEGGTVGGGDARGPGEGAPGPAPDRSRGAAMKSPVVKRSIVVAGIKTSVSLEEAFWNGMKEISGLRNMTLSELVGEIDGNRQQGNLSSAIRLFVLDYFKSRAMAAIQAEKVPA